MGWLPENWLDAIGDDELTRVAFTSRWVAAERAMESERPDALFSDPYAAALGGAAGKELSAKMNSRMTGSYWADYHITWMAVRTRFVDERLAAFARAVGGRGQFVCLGSGLDARAYRLDALAGMRAAFEVDLPEVVAAFGRAMGRLGAQAKCPRVALAIDLSAPEELSSALRLAGFDSALPTFWLMEGLTMYLPPEVNARLLSTMASLSASGSQLCSGIIADPSRMPKHALPPFTPPIDEYDALCRRHGWAASRVPETGLAAHRFGDPALDYGRYPKGVAPDLFQCFMLCSRG